MANWNRKGSSFPESATVDNEKPVPDNNRHVEHHPDVDLDTVSLLVPRAKDGSSEAREQLLEHIQGYMSLMAKQNSPTNLQGKFGTSDIVQQSLAQVIRGFDGFRGSSKGEFYAWLKTIVANEAKKLQRDFHRDKRDVKRERQLANDVSGSGIGFVPTDMQPTPRANAIAAEQIQQLHGALQRLPNDYAQVIRLRSLERLSFKDVAQQMNRSFDSVTKLWYRAILKLQQELESDNESAVE